MLSDYGKTPNKHTVYMGEMIKKAREEVGLSQEELGEKIYRKRLAVSEMENGKVEISAWTLPLLADALKKPLSYFYPPFLQTDIPEESLNSKEHELITYFRDIDEHLSGVAIELVKVVANFDPHVMILESHEFAVDRKEREDALRKVIENKQRKTKE